VVELITVATLLEKTIIVIGSISTAVKLDASYRL